MANEQQKKSTKSKNCISINEMAQVLNCTPSNIRALLNAGLIAGYKTQIGWKVKRSDFDEYLGDYVSILEAKARIVARQKELEDKEQEFIDAYKGLYHSLRFLDGFVKEIERIFDNYQDKYVCEEKRVNISDIICKGWPEILKEKSEKWNLTKTAVSINIAHNMNHFLNNLKKFPAYIKTKSENEVLKEKLEITETNLKLALSKLEAYDSRMSEKLAENEQMPILLKKIDNYFFSVRLLNCLRNAGIEYVGEILNYTRADLLKFRNFGQKSLDELEEFFTSNGIKW